MSSSDCNVVFAMADSNADGEAKAIDVDETVSATRDENSKRHLQRRTALLTAKTVDDDKTGQRREMRIQNPLKLKMLYMPPDTGRLVNKSD